jgi:hypothetical protein
VTIQRVSTKSPRKARLRATYFHAENAQASNQECSLQWLQIFLVQAGRRCLQQGQHISRVRIWHACFLAVLENCIVYVCDIQFFLAEGNVAE